MKRTLLAIFFAIPVLLHAEEPKIEPSEKALPMPGAAFLLDGKEAFVILPEDAGENISWVWYAPTLKGLPSDAEQWMFRKFLGQGIAIAGIDVGESYGSPEGRKTYETFYNYLVESKDFGKKPCLLARSRGGLMLYSWAAEHPESVGGIAGIYPVCDIASYPGVEKAAGAYGMTAEELEADLAKHNPIDRLEALAKAGVPVFHIHGDADKTVPLEKNSDELVKRYVELGGPAKLEIPEGQGHNMWKGFFRSEELADFVIAAALGEPVEFGKPSPDVEGKVVLDGKLTGGIMAIGGETTGWLLSYEEEGKSKTIEVDMSAMEVPEVFSGKDVKVIGTMYTKNYVERGPVLILKAENIQVDQ